MKKYIFPISIVFFVILKGYSQPEAHPGKNSVFVYCGTDLPKNFIYRISRRENTQNNWQVMTETHFPANRASWEGRIFREVNNSNRGDLPDSATIEILWRKLKISSTDDSLYFLAGDPSLLSACGTGWWDRTVEKNRQYRYRIERVQGSRVLNESTTKTISVPGETPRFVIHPDSIYGNGTSVTLNFNLIRYKGLAGCQVYRRYYLRGNFERIHPVIMYSGMNDEKHMSVIDESVMDKAQYSYYLIPYDIYGNEGQPTDTLNVYNVRINTIPAMVMGFHAASFPEENSLKLSWRLNNTEDLVSIDIYKAVVYDGYYTRIATVPAGDTSFLDHNVQPERTYYYTLVLNAAFGKTFPSARFPAIYKGTKKNPFPPANLTATRTGNIVRLQWERRGANIRGYYIYRSTEFTGPMMPVSGIYLDSAAVVTYTDTLNHTPGSPVWVYAVASENSSYNISPLSQRVSVIGKTASLPVPTDLNARVRDNRVELYWDDMNEINPMVTGYLVYRQSENNPGQTVSSATLLNKTPTGYGVNSFIDTTISEGLHYFYSVESVGLDTSDTSSPSLETGVFIPENLPVAPGQLRVMNTTGGVLLQWTAPMDASVKNFRILRAEKGEILQPVQTLPAGNTEWVDKNVHANTVYFYQVVSVDGNGRQSVPGEPLGIRSSEQK